MQRAIMVSSILIGAICAGATSAQAASVKEVFEKYNQLGTFAWDCSKPPSPSNLYYLNRAIDADHVQRDEMSGETTREHVTIIDRAQPVGPNEISLSGQRDERPAEGVWRVEGDRQLATEVTLDGKRVISGGKNVSSGRPIPWTNRCEK
jgi:hypothetical protein